MAGALGLAAVGAELVGGCEVVLGIGCRFGVGYRGGAAVVVVVVVEFECWSL
jgi:hypothetical protein